MATIFRLVHLKAFPNGNLGDAASLEHHSGSHPVCSATQQLNHPFLENWLPTVLSSLRCRISSRAQLRHAGAAQIASEPDLASGAAANGAENQRKIGPNLKRVRPAENAASQGGKSARNVNLTGRGYARQTLADLSHWRLAQHIATHTSKPNSATGT